VFAQLGRVAVRGGVGRPGDAPAARVKPDTLTGVVPTPLGPGSRLAALVIRTGRCSPNPWPPGGGCIVNDSGAPVIQGPTPGIVSIAWSVGCSKHQPLAVFANQPRPCPLSVGRKMTTKPWSAVGFAHAVEKR
jgi:hypothetical protein